MEKSELNTNNILTFELDNGLIRTYIKANCTKLGMLNIEYFLLYCKMEISSQHNNMWHNFNP